MLEISNTPPFVCVNCGHAANKTLYREYGNKSFVNSHTRSPSTAGSSKLLTNEKNQTHRLTECGVCSKPVDEYVQLDYNILFLDAILQKISVYRHILLNCRLSSQNALKLAIIFGLCEAFQRWTQLNGAASGISCAQNVVPENVGKKSYYELEMSFYITFILVIIENLSFNLVFYVLFRLSAFIKIVQWNRPVAADISFVDVCFALIICNFGKLFLIPSFLYASELKLIVDHLIGLFWMFSIVRCAQVKGHRFLDRSSSFLLVIITVLLNAAFQYFILRPMFASLTAQFFYDPSTDRSLSQALLVHKL